jgi:CubicO group peptidase (beta-lactamase class C family)
MKSISRWLFVGVLLSLVTTACQPVRPLTPVAAADQEVILEQDVITTIESAIESTIAETGVPGVAIGIVKDGKVAYVRGFGVMELGKEQLVMPQSIFNWASVAKSVTAIAIMQLVEQDKIELDASITDYLSYFQMADERYQAITVRQLMSHMAGIPDHPPAERVDAYRHTESDEGALERYVRNLSDTSLLSAPGEQWAYSTIGFAILGDVVAKVSGQPFEAYVQEHIFTPLRMSHTTLLLKEVAPESLVSPHVANDAGAVVVSEVYPYSRSFAGGSGLFSNVEDMTRYALAQLKRGELDGVRILSETSYDLMWEAVTETDIPDPTASHYGLGWMIGDHNGHRTIGHDGLIQEFNAFLTLLPDDNLAVVLVVNYTDSNNFIFPAFMLRGPILDALLSTEQ